MNGAKAEYNFKIVPGFEIERNDKLYLGFPPEVSLPTSFHVTCRGDSMV